METFEEEPSDSSSVPNASSDLKLDLAAGVSLTGVSLLDRRGRAKLDPPKLVSDLKFESPPKLGCSSFGI